MKSLGLVNNVWIERINPNITPEERHVLEDRTLPPSEQQRTLMENIRNRSQQAASETDSAAAQAIYDANKIPDAILITVDITLPSGTGIINCRVNGEHKQVRF